MAHRARHPGHHAAPHAVNIRRFVLQAHLLDELVTTGTLTTQAARFLEAAVASGLNVLVSGGTQAGNPTSSRYTR